MAGWWVFLYWFVLEGWRHVWVLTVAALKERRNAQQH